LGARLLARTAKRRSQINQAATDPCADRGAHPASIVNEAPISFFACANSRGLFTASTAIRRRLASGTPRSFLRGVAAEHGRVVAV
jgi:hypothetical protein